MFILRNAFPSSRQVVRFHKAWNLIFGLILLVTLVGIAPSTALAAPDAGARPPVYRNPLSVTIPGDGMVTSCADPSIIRGQTAGDTDWYIYCTTDPLNADDRNASGGFNFHLIPILRSHDLVNWTYAGDAFATRPAWVAADAGMWAPDIHYFNGRYYLYYAASNTSLPGGGSAVGVATAPSPTGPWTDSGTPAVEPHDAPCCPGSRRWVYDPAMITDESGQMWIYYGSYFGGISVRQLSADGLHSDPATQVEVTIANRYEGAFVVRHAGFYYLFASATDCCRGPLTGYSVFVGRSENVTGPFVDKEGVPLTAGRVGGTLVISMNGNRWVGPGHNAVFTDFAGQDWFVYHAIDRNSPYFETGFTRRPVLMDQLVWVDGWPSVRNGQFASDTPQPAPAAQPGDHRAPVARPVRDAKPGLLIGGLSDSFSGTALNTRRWTWVRPPDPTTFSVADGTFNFQTQAADLFEDSNNASVLTEATPRGQYIVETKVSLDLPPEGCCYNYVQAGLVIYGDDNNFIKLAHVSIWETRQTEFAKELFPVPDGYPRYGNTVVSEPGDWTYLRIARTIVRGEENYTAYTSRDGKHWTHGGTWTHQLGSGAKIGLVAMGGSGFTAKFDYVKVYTLRP